MADTWTPISGYTPQDYTDTMVFEMSSETKKVQTIMGQALVAGEENSQYIKFVLDRFWDGIDISGKTFSIEYALSGLYYGTSEAVNAEMTTDKVRFGWIVPETACCVSGKLLFVIRVESEDYILKSQIVEVSVYKTINVEDVVPEPTREAWYREFEARVEVAIDDAEAALAQAQQAVTVAETAAQNAQTAEDNAEQAAASAQIRYGSPLTAQTAEEMTDENRVYVYVGAESGYTSGNWYYYDGSAWVSGGVYNGTGINTDTTLTQSGMAADAKATGDEISQIKEELSEYEGIFTADVDESVQNWLDEHPEATTTVLDGSITKAKLSSDVKQGFIVDSDNVSTMVSDNSLTVGMLVRTKRFHNGTSIGGGLYEILNTGTANGVDVIALANGLYAHLIYNPYFVYASQFGCSQTLNDCSANLNRALDCTSTHGALVIDERRLNVRSAIVINNEFVSVVGMGTCFIWSYIDNGPSLKVHAQGCKIKGIQLLNALNDTSNPIIDDTVGMEIINSNGTNWYDLDFEMCECQLAYFSVGVQAYGKNCYIHDCVFSNIAKGVVFNTAYNGAYTVQHRGCVVESCQFHGGNHDLTANVTSFDTFPCFGVSLVGASRETIVKNNRFDSDYSGYMFKGSSAGVVIEGNISESYSPIIGIAILNERGSGDSYTPFVIKNNRISLFRQLENKQSFLQLQKPIVIINSYNGLVADNTINYYSSLVYLSQNSNGLTIKGNNVIVSNIITDISCLIGCESGNANNISVTLVGNAVTTTQARTVPILKNLSSANLSIGNSNYQNCNALGNFIL